MENIEKIVIDIMTIVPLWLILLKLQNILNQLKNK